MNWTISAAMYFYFVFVGACYLLGFWTPLHFNIFEFLSPVDILKSATYPVIPAALGVFFYVLMDSYNSQGTRKPEGNDPKAIKVLFWILAATMLIIILINIFLLITHLYHLFISEPERRLSYALPVATFIASVYLVLKPPFMKESSKLARNFVIIFTCVLPTVSYFQGDKNIRKILEGEASYYKLKQTSTNCEVSASSDMIYLGLHGNRYVFIDSESQDICIESDNSILLTYYKYIEKDEGKASKPDEKVVLNKTITNQSTQTQ